MAQDDPTDHALAAIASILDSGDKRVSMAEVKPVVEEAPVASPPVAPESPAPEVDVDSYSKLGPGPLDAIRFRWSARRDDSGLYFVDETIGPNSRPLVLGPMKRDDVVAFIDTREANARRRFDALKNEMTFGKRVADYDSASENES